MSITASQFVVNSKDTSTFVGIMRHVKTSGVKSAKEGDIYGLLKISSTGDFPAERVAHMSWDGVVDGYLYSESKSTTESLKMSLEEFTRRLKDLMRNDSKLESEGIDVDLVVVLIKKDGVYIANLGESDIYTYKDQKIVSIKDVLVKNKAQTAGLVVKKDDVLVVSTPNYLKENIKVLVGRKNKKDVLSNLAILGKKITADEGILYVYEEETNLEETPEEVVEEKVVEKKSEPIPKVKKEKKVKDYSKIKALFSTILVGVSRVFASINAFLKRVSTNLFNLLQQRLGNQRWFKKISAKLSEKGLGRRKYSSPNIQIDGYKQKGQKSKRVKLLVLIFLGILLVAGGYQYAKNQKILREVSKEANQNFDEIESYVEEANEKIRTDRSSAETLIFQANNLVEGLNDDLNEKDSARKEDVLAKLVAVEDLLYRREAVEPESFMGFYGEGAKTGDMKYVIDSKGNEYLIVTDEGAGFVYTVSLYDKSSSPIADNNGLLESPKFVDIGANLDIFVYDSEVGVVKAAKADSGWGSIEKLTGVTKSNINIKEVTEFARFTANDNVYYLDRAGKRIARSSNFGSGFSSTVVSVLNHDGFDKANDFFADLSIYILTEGNNGIIRFSQNIEHPISIIGVDGELGRLLAGDTHNDMNAPMVVFDEGSSRVLVFEKPKDAPGDKLHPNELHLTKQFVYRGNNTDMWKNVKAVSIDRAYKNIYVLDGNNVWRIGL